MNKNYATKFLEEYCKYEKEMIKKYGEKDGRTFKDLKKLIDAIETCIYHDDWCEEEKRGCEGCIHYKKR